MKMGRKPSAAKRMGAWLLVFAMTLTAVNIPVKVTEAADINLTVKSGSNSVTIAKNVYGTDYIGDMFFNIPSQIKTKDAISTNKVTSVEVKLTVNAFTQGSGESARAMIFAQPNEDGDWKWNQSETADLVKGQQITLSFPFSSMNWNGGSEMGNLGVRFANAADGSTVSYTINSAKLITSEGSAIATKAPSSGGSTGTGSVSDVSITRTMGDGSNQYYAEYSFSITNKSSSAITGIQILIPTSKEVSVGYTNGFTASYDAAQGGVVVYYSATLEAGQTVNSSDNKVGFSLGGATVRESYVIAVNCGGPAGSDLDYELTGLKNVPFSETPVGRHGKLSVSPATGYTAPVLTDEAGTPVQLRGASTHGMHWFPDYINKTAFQTLRDDWGINLVRLVCYPRDVGDVGYVTGGETTKNKLDTLIQNGVDYASDLGMYALVDWHVHAYNPNEYINEAKEFFTKYATMYKDKENVLYEICNEPTGTPWYNGGSNDLYTYCKEIIKTIRAIDADAVIICGTNTWSQDVDEVAAHPMKELGYENIMYTFHFYSATHYGSFMDKVKTATAAGTPIFVTEFGVCSADGNGNYDTANATAWLELLDSLNISFACWSYSNCNEKSAYFTQSCSKKEGGWTSDDLTTTGKWLINTCRAREEKELGLPPSVKPTNKPTSEPSSSPLQTPGGSPETSPSAGPGTTPSGQPIVTPSPQPVKEPQAAPNVTLAKVSRGSDSITVSVSEEAPSGSTYEYSVDGVNWQRENTFTGLQPTTEYTVSVRFAETDELAASPAAAETVKIGTLVKDIYEIDLSKLKDATYVNGMYGKDDASGTTSAASFDEGNKQLTLFGTEKTFILTGSYEGISIVLGAGVKVSLQGATCGAIEGSDNTKLTVDSGSNQTDSIHVSDVTVNGGVITAEAAEGSNKAAISADTITLNQGTVIATGDGTGAAVYAENKIVLAGGNLSVLAGENKTTSSAIDVSERDDSVIVIGNTAIENRKPGANGLEGLFSKQESDVSGAPIVWKQITYQIDGETKTSTAKQGASIALLDVPKAGYKLVWHKDTAQGAVYQVGDTYLLEEDVVFVAEYIYIQNTDDGDGQNTDIKPTQKPSPVKVTGMKLTANIKNVKGYPVKKKVQLAPKKSMQLRVALLPASAKGQKLTFKSNNASVAKVSASGKVVAGKKAGKAVITITSQSGYQKKLTVQVMKKAVKKITLKASKKKIKVKKKLKLKAKVSPGKSSSSKTLYWKSSNPKVATVTQKGVVKAKKKGKVKITAYATDGSGKKKAIKLTIK